MNLDIGNLHLGKSMPYFERSHRAGGKIFYEVKGQGDPLVLLRGLGRVTEHWLGFDEELSKNFKTITMDLQR